MSVRSVSLYLLLFSVAGCAHMRGDAPPQAEIIRAGSATFELRYLSEDAAVAWQVVRVLERAAASAERWGRFSAPILITIHPTHQALEEATCLRGYHWLRAWATYSSIDLQSPRTWSFGNASDTEMAQLLTHELSHCLLYQSAATRATWAELRVPIWFLEGMACFTANRARTQSRLELVWHYYQEKAAGHLPRVTGNPLSEPEPLYRSSSDLIYGAAHEAFTLLVEHRGAERIRQLIAAMGQGSDFFDAFRSTMGVPVGNFEVAFEHYAAHRAGTGSAPHANEMSIRSATCSRGSP